MMIFFACAFIQAFISTWQSAYYFCRYRYFPSWNDHTTIERDERFPNLWMSSLPLRFFFVVFLFCNTTKLHHRLELRDHTRASILSLIFFSQNSFIFFQSSSSLARIVPMVLKTPRLNHGFLCFFSFLCCLMLRSLRLPFYVRLTFYYLEIHLARSLHRGLIWERNEAWSRRAVIVMMSGFCFFCFTLVFPSQEVV